MNTITLPKIELKGWWLVMSNYRLMQGDCLDKLNEVQDGSVDLLLTDPPYNISQNNNFSTMKSANRQGVDFVSWDKDFDLTS